MRTRYYVYKEVPGDEAHEHDMVRSSGHDTVEEAREAMQKITGNLYARIEKHTEEYTPPPFGKVYRDESYGWETQRMEVVEEN
jgi:hypothetical protein